MAKTEAWIEALLKNRDRGQSVIRVLSASLLLSETGGSMSEVKKLTCQMVRGDGATVTESFVVKELPPGSFAREMVLESGANFIEFTVYRDVLPSMESLLREQSLSDEPLWPKCIAMNPYDKIVLEDLTVQGFKTVDRVVGLDFDHCVLVMQNLGLYHALSVGLKETGIARSAYDRNFFERYPNHRKLLIEDPFKNLLKEMEGWGQEWAEVLEKLKVKLDGFQEAVLDSLKSREGKFEVLTHGDCWTNNFLFKYSVYTGKPMQMKFVDFQLSTLTTPAVDLVVFLITSPNLETRARSQELISVYYESLILNMNRLGLTTHQPSYQFIKSELNRLIYLKLHSMAFYLPKILVRREEKKFNFDDLRGDTWREEYNEYLIEIFRMILMEAVKDGFL